jgi:ectoine hydroxylase-related dioxygenase (phytanoyl-CoA dioxygenase family)
MRPAPLRPVTDEEADAFHRDGAVLVRGVLDDRWLALVASGLDEAIAAPDALSSDLGALRVDQFPAARSSGLRQIIEASPLAEIVGTALRSPVSFYMDQLFHKPAGMVPSTAWHQDTCYYNVEGHDLIRAWVSPDPVPRHLSLEVVRGSHLWNATYSPIAGRDPRDDLEAREQLEAAHADEPMIGADAFEGWSYWSGVKDASLPAVPEIELHRDSFDIIGWDYEPGDVLLFHGHILHSALGGAVSETGRRAHASLWAGRDVRYVHRPGQVIPDPVALYEHDPRSGQYLVEFPDVFPILFEPGQAPGYSSS